jgi:hypothetical protein
MLSLLGSVAYGATAQSVHAQELSRIVAGDMPTVRDRFEGLGYRAGQFWVLPSVETGVFYDSNVFGEAMGANDDWGVYVSPNVAVKSDFGRHAVNMRVGLDHFEYFDLSQQSRTNFDGELDGRFDIRSDLVVLGGIKGGKFVQTPGDLEYPTPGLPTSPGDYYTLETWGSINKAFNRLTTSVGVAYKMYDYDDVNGVDQDFRDGDVITVGGRVGYIVSPGYSVYGDFRYNWRDYDGMTIQDSEGWRAFGGVAFEITHLVHGEVGVGYMEQTYDSAGSPTTGGWTYHGALVWNPTQLMTVRLDADRTVEDSTLIQAGRIQDKLKLEIDYEVLRSLILSPSFGFAYNDYQNSPLDDFRYDAGVDLEYRMNRFLSVGSRYKYSYSDPSGPGLMDWDRHLVGIYAKARF